MTIGPESNLSTPSGYSSSDLVFNDNFSGTSLDSRWNPYITDNKCRGMAMEQQWLGRIRAGWPIRC